MNIRRNLGYAALCAGLFGAGVAADRYAAVRPLQNQIASLEQRASAAEQRSSELQRELGQYSVRLQDGRIARLNNDMSVTISGISGDRTLDMAASEYRMSLRR